VQRTIRILFQTTAPGGPDDGSVRSISFVPESEGHGMGNEPRALMDIKRYVRNLALRFAPAA